MKIINTTEIKSMIENEFSHIVESVTESYLNKLKVSLCNRG